MTSAANSQAYGSQGGGSPWGPGPAWHQHPYWQSPWAPHNLPRPLGIALTVLGFILWWPVGLAILFYMIGSGRMGCRSFRRYGNNTGGPWQGGAPWSTWKSWCGGERAAADLGQSRVRRIPRRDPPPAGGGAEGIRCLPGAPALRQGQGRVRPVHGRPPAAAGSAGPLGAAGRLTSQNDPPGPLAGPCPRAIARGSAGQRFSLWAGRANAHRHGRLLSPGSCPGDLPAIRAPRPKRRWPALVPGTRARGQEPAMTERTGSACALEKVTPPVHVLG